MVISDVFHAASINKKKENRRVVLNQIQLVCKASPWWAYLLQCDENVAIIKDLPLLIKSHLISLHTWLGKKITWRGLCVFFLQPPPLLQLSFIIFSKTMGAWDWECVFSLCETINNAPGFALQQRSCRLNINYCSHQALQTALLSDGERLISILIRLIE